MRLQQYNIYQISARTLLSEGEKTAEGYCFFFNMEAPSNSMAISKTRQNDCGMFRQLFWALHGAAPKDWNEDSDSLLHALIYLDFSGIFDRPPVGWVKELRERAEQLFSPEGVMVDFGRDRYRFVAFERSASMSRENKLSFIREDLFASVWERITLGMEIRQCQLSKLYAYNGLLFSDGKQIADYYSQIEAEHIIIVDNPHSIVKNVPVITVEDDGTGLPVRRYSRVEKNTDVEVMEYDGEGLVSKEFGEELSHEAASEGGHFSFQIRMPYIKGVVHAVDFQELFLEFGVTEIKDIFGQRHPVDKVKMILTRSMFKGLSWMKENGLSWKEYLNRCRKYGHRLYVTGVDHRNRDGLTELNYQLLNTAAITAEEYRPASLSFAWDSSPENDHRTWLTKATETAYYNSARNETWQLEYFLSELRLAGENRRTARLHRSELLQKNPAFLRERVFQKELQDKAQSILAKFSIGKLMISGETRYLSDDLMRLLAFVIRPSSETAYSTLMQECLSGAVIYAPQPSFPMQPRLTVLRNPHISRNEEVLATPVANVGPLREKYLSHLYYVAMVDSRTLISDRLGGADYDGDTVHIYADPILNECIRRNYEGGLENENNLPLLKIPDAEPLVADASDWRARFEAVKSTFSSRIGQISNAALRRSILAYDEHTEDWQRKRYRDETEILTILTGLEIDSAKTGVKPDLSEYLADQRDIRSRFLRYKQIVGDPDEHQWYEPTKYKRLQDYFLTKEWDAVTANLERTPLYARELAQQTSFPTAAPADSSELFRFAADPNWRDMLNPTTMEKVKTLIESYEEAKRRCEAIRRLAPSDNCRRDTRRILFARDQEEVVSIDEMYLIFQNCYPYEIRDAYAHFREINWQFTPPEQRAEIALEIIGWHPKYLDVLCDFRYGGYRILGDILEDIYTQQQILATKKNAGIKKDDSELMKDLMRGVFQARDYREQLRWNCSNANIPTISRHAEESLEETNKDRLDVYELIMCAEALGKRDFILEVFPVAARRMAVDLTTKPKKRWWHFW